MHPSECKSRLIASEWGEKRSDTGEKRGGKINRIQLFSTQSSKAAVYLAKRPQPRNRGPNVNKDIEATGFSVLGFLGRGGGGGE